ncbi:MAG: hypothetical protein WB586_16870 [Chthoniobacterales bacterium]
MSSSIQQQQNKYSICQSLRDQRGLRASLLLLLLRQVEPALTRHGGGIRLTCIPGIHRDQDMMSIESRTEVTVVTEDSF